MKDLIYKIWLIGMVAVIAPACNDILEAEEQNAVDGDRVFNDANLSLLYLNNIYNSVLPGFGALSGVGLSDESIGGGDLIYGLYLDPVDGSQDSYGPYSIATYATIRNINLFLEGVGNGAIQEEDKAPLLGQAYFMRAWKYWELVLHYGGVPLTLEPQDVNDGDANQLSRESAATCVAQIVSDLDMALELIGEYDAKNYGRISRAAAAAFKGRVLLFYASPQFDPNGVDNADGVAERWESAYQANVEARQIAEASGHGLYPNFEDIFLQEDNQEAIMIRKYSTGLNTHGYENSVRPRSVNNSGTPTGTPNWDFVQAFPMKDGTSITESADYDETVYWKDRDPRFYATVAYNSAQWEFEGRDGTRQWAYLDNDQESGVIPFTGFYLRKHVDTSIPNTETVRTPTDWIEIRYAEVLLNLAECANETNRPTEAYTELYAIRERAGIESGGGTYGIPTGLPKAELREVIMNERRIELAFEDKRYWDLRRRNLYINGVDGTAGAGLNSTRRKRIQTNLDTDYIINSLEPGVGAAANPADSALYYFETYVRDTVDWDNPSNYDLFFNTLVEEGESMDIDYQQPKYNFFFLPPNAIGLNPKLEQTIGWAGGQFDPLLN